MPKYDLTNKEMKMLMEMQGIKVRPSYCHDDYLFTSFTMPYPLKNKLDKISKKYGLTRSKVVQLLIEDVEVDNFLTNLKKFQI